MNLKRFRQAWKKRIWVPVLRSLHSEVEVQVGGRRMLVDLNDHIIGSLLYLHGEYETDVQGLMKYLDLRGSVCVDIGANIGLHTMALSALVGDSGKVFAYEPESHNFRLLKHNILINKATNTTARRLAIGDTEGTCSLELNTTNFGDHRVATHEQLPGTREKVQLTTLDAELGELSAGIIRFIKIDVQGYEYQVIRGMKETLARNPDVTLMMEVFPEALQGAGSSATELMEYLRELGFSGWELQSNRVLPVSEPWVYELIRDGKDVNMVLSRNSTLLQSGLERWYREGLSAPFN